MLCTVDAPGVAARRGGRGGRFRGRSAAAAGAPAAGAALASPGGRRLRALLGGVLNAAECACGPGAVGLCQNSARKILSQGWLTACTNLRLNVCINLYQHDLVQQGR